MNSLIGVTSPQKWIGLAAIVGFLVGIACSNSGAAPASQTLAEDLPSVESDIPTAAVIADVGDAEDPLSPVLKMLNPTGPKEFEPRAFRQLLDRDRITPIYEPDLVTPEEARLDLEDMVMGVSIGEKSRAYPIRTLRFREMVDDELGGVPILVTW